MIDKGNSLDNNLNQIFVKNLWLLILRVGSIDEKFKIMERFLLRWIKSSDQTTSLVTHVIKKRILLRLEFEPKWLKNQLQNPN